MTTLVTGADGLLGSHLVRELLARGSHVRAMVQAGSDSPTLDGLDIERVTGDLLEGDSLRSCIDGARRVVHCAALTDMWAPAQAHRSVNLEGTRNVAEACLEAGVERMLLVGSASAIEFGTIDEPGDEEGGFPPDYTGFAYMESKHAAMALVRDMVANRGLHAAIVAPTFLLGEHDWRPSSGELLLEYLRRGLPVVPPGGRNFAFAPDVAAAAINALERSPAGDCTILGGHNLTYEDFFTVVARCAGATPPRGAVPPWVMTALGRAGDGLGELYRRAGRSPSRVNSDLMSLSRLGTYYSNRKAREQLDMALTPIPTAVRASLRSLRHFGHLPPDPLEGKVALVTGASRGVGFATARALGLRGCPVTVTARGEQRLSDSVAKLEAEGTQVIGVAGDVARWEDASSMVDATIEGFGRLDLLVNNAGVSMRGSFEDLSPEVCAETINTNLLGPIYLSRAAVSAIGEVGGSIVFVSSIAGLIGLPGASTYCASKGALTGLCESLRLELGPAGVHVGVVHVGFTEHDPDKRVLGARGEALLPDRPAHQTQAQVADRIVAMMIERKARVTLTPVGHLGSFAHRLSPRMVERVIAKAQASELAVFKAFA